MDSPNAHDVDLLRSKAEVDEMMTAMHEELKAVYKKYPRHYYFAFAGERFGTRGADGQAMLNMVSVMEGCSGCGLTGVAKLLVDALPLANIAYFLNELSQEAEKKVMRENPLLGFATEGKPVN